MGPLLKSYIADITGVAVMDSLVSLQLEGEFEQFHAFAAFERKLVSGVLHLVVTKQMVFMKALPTNITIILLHFVDLLHVLPETVLVGEGSLTLITLNFLVGGLQSFMIYLFVTLEVSVPCEIFITEITFERSLA